MTKMESRRTLNPTARTLTSRRSMIIPDQQKLQRKTTKAQIQEVAAKNPEAAQIMASLKGTGKKWEDPAFPASASSLHPNEPSSTWPPIYSRN